ncbi:MAG: ABC transporter permease [Muribaculum sp.]|nr:ABC transporter permease [Muribaculaceae bacterium]MCM1081114.1 ABC transporter permease [Muribaculum sp.]
MESLRIAVRYLLARRSKSAVSVISLISVIGVGVAAMAIVCVLSVFNGFTSLASSQVNTLTADIRVAPASGKVVTGLDSVLALIGHQPEVEAAAPVLEERALIKNGAYQMPVWIKGVTDEYTTVTEISKSVKDDGVFLLNDSMVGPMAVLAVGPAIRLHQYPGLDSHVELYVPRRLGRINPANPAAAFRTANFTVAGVFQVDDAETDADVVIIPFNVAARLLERDDAASSIELKLHAGSDVDAVAGRLSRQLGNQFSIATRSRQNLESLKMIAVEKWITFALMAFILIIASFNIISTLSMMVIEKTDNIHTMFALGADRSFISSIFRYEGWLISLLGGLGGVVVGVILCLAQQSFGFIKLGGDHEAMVTDVYPVRVDCVDLVAVMALVAAVGWVTATLTAAFTRRRLALRAVVKLTDI